MEPEIELRLLIEKLAAPDITPSERTSLEAEFISVMRLHIERQRPLEDEDASWEPMVAAILSQQTTVRSIPFYKKTWFRIAASILLCLPLGTYFILKPKPKSEPKTETTAIQNKINDVLPGSNKATLTLSNGSKIMLDSAHNGLLAQQNGSSVFKSDSGKINYTKNDKANAVAYNTLTTPRGGQYQITLPDGTRVWLNAASSITYPTSFTGKERKVEITGEAYFEVIHNAKQPFIVKVNNTEIQDIGTSFNVNAYSNEPSLNTTLITGSVKIRNNNQNKILKPGQQAEISKEIKNNIEIKYHPDLEETMAWKNGRFLFNRADIQTVMRQVSRWYDVEVVYEGSTPVGHYRGDMSRNVPVSQMLRVLELSGMHFRIEGKKIIVNP